MSGFLWSSKEQVLAVHNAAIVRYGGAPGVHDEGLLDSALARPFASFGGNEAFPDNISKACALCHAIISNHPFIDGNKRAGAAILGMTLRADGVQFKPRHTEFYDAMIGVAAGDVSLESLTKWVKSQVR